MTSRFRCTCLQNPETCWFHARHHTDPTPDEIREQAAEIRRIREAARLGERNEHPGRRLGELREYTFRGLMHPD